MEYSITFTGEEMEYTIHCDKGKVDVEVKYISCNNCFTIPQPPTECQCDWTIQRGDRVSCPSCGPPAPTNAKWTTHKFNPNAVPVPMDLSS